MASYEKTSSELIPLKSHLVEGLSSGEWRERSGARAATWGINIPYEKMGSPSELRIEFPKHLRDKLMISGQVNEMG